MSLTTEELFRAWVHKRVLWSPIEGIKVEVKTIDVRRAFGRIDVLIKPYDTRGSGEAWVDSKAIEVVE